MAESSIRLIVDAAGAVNPLKRVTKETKKLDKVTRDASGRLRNAKGHFIGVGTGARGAAKGVNALGGALKAALLPLAGFAVVSKFFEGFQEADRAAAAVKTLGVNAKDLQKELEGVANRSGGLASTTQLMAAAYDVASAGFSNASDNSKILEASLKGAIGGMSDVATVSDAATSVLNSYGLSADKAGKLIDGFIQTQNDGKIIVGQYAGQIGKLAPIASAAGVGIDELNAAIATTTASGVPVESTFAGLRQGIASILKPSSEAQKLAEALGIEFNAAGLKAKGFGGLIDEVNRKTGGSTTAMTTLFGSVEAVGAILPIASGNMETFNKNLDNQRTKSGQSADAALVMGDTVSQSIVKMTNKISDLIRKLDTALGPAISGIITIINAVIDAATGAISTLEHMFSLSKNTTIAVQTIKSGNISEGFGRSLMGIDELIGGDRRKALQKEAGFGKVIGVNREERDSKFLELLRKQPEIKVLIEGPQKTTDPSKPVVTEDPELAALRARVEALLSGNATPTGGSNEEEEKATALKQQQETFAKYMLDKKREQLLIEAQTPEQRAQLELAMEKFDLNRQFPDMSEKELELARQQLQTSFDSQVATDERIKKEKKAAKDKKDAQDAEAKRLDDLKQKQIEIAQAIQNQVVGAIESAIDGSKSLAESFSGLLKQLAMMIIKQKVIGSFASLGGGGLLGLIPGLADGGPARAGRPHIVGERGPELFVPKSSGTVVPNHAMGGGANVTVNVDASGSNVQGDQPDAKALGSAIGAAVQAELIKQKRPGGLLSA